MNSSSAGILEYAAKFREGLKAETDITNEISNTLNNLCWLVRREGRDSAPKDPFSPTFESADGLWLVTFYDRSIGIVEEVIYLTCDKGEPKFSSRRLMSFSPDARTPVFVGRKYSILKEIHSSMQYLIDGMAGYLPSLSEPLRGYAELADYAASLKGTQSSA